MVSVTLSVTPYCQIGRTIAPPSDGSVISAYKKWKLEAVEETQVALSVIFKTILEKCEMEPSKTFD